jgi:hypothetical protein
MKLIMLKKLKFERGKFWFTDRYMTFLPLETLKEMTLDAYKNGERAINQLYFYGWHFGFIVCDSYMKTFKLKPFEESYKLIMDVAVLFGWGDYKTEEFYHKKFSRFKNIENPFGLLFYPSKKKVCHFIRGVNAGGGTALHGVIMNGIELECTANNKKYCLFMNVVDPILKEKYGKVVKEQLDLKWLKKKQLAFLKDQNLNPEDFLKYE